MNDLPNISWIHPICQTTTGVYTNDTDQNDYVCATRKFSFEDLDDWSLSEFQAMLHNVVFRRLLGFPFSNHVAHCPRRNR